MGLDMYLYRKRYVKNWDHMSPDQLHEVTLKEPGRPRQVINPTYIIEEVGYWRKANQIHNWFVQNVQGGVDDCLPHYVDRDKLELLLKIVREVLGASELVDAKVQNGTMYDKDGEHAIIEDGQVIVDPTKARELLPTADGFFFGDTEYTHWYVEDLRETERIILQVFADDPDGRFEYEYQSSW